MVNVDDSSNKVFVPLEASRDANPESECELGCGAANDSDDEYWYSDVANTSSSSENTFVGLKRIIKPSSCDEQRDLPELRCQISMLVVQKLKFRRSHETSVKHCHARRRYSGERQ